MARADVASWRCTFFSGCRVQLHIVRLRHWPAWLILQMCHVKEHLDWPSVNRVPNLLRYFMLCIFFACMGPWLLACWDCGFISHTRHVCLSLAGVACCQVEVSAMGWSLVQGCPTERGVSECDCEATIMRGPWPTGDSCAIGGLSMCFACLDISVLQVDIRQISLILAIWRFLSPGTWCLVVW